VLELGPASLGFLVADGEVEQAIVYSAREATDRPQDPGRNRREVVSTRADAFLRSREARRVLGGIEMI
jgi:hypothetical protein